MSLTAAQPLLRVENLQAWYGESHILHGVDLSVFAGEVVALLGRNGAGKTSTLKSIIGMLRKRTGSVVFDRKETIRFAAEKIAHLGMAYCPEERAIFSSLSVRENLLLPPAFGRRGMPLEQIFAVFPNLEARLSTSQGTKLSGGEQQMLAIARLLRAGARFIVLDEPTEGLAPVIVNQIAKMIHKLKRDGYTVLLVEQNFHFASKIADRFYIMEEGRILDGFSVSEIDGKMSDLSDLLGV